ncbi:single-stranded-DNA-specific exonuclease RecJ, partial [Klebsiella pneumoniae]|nr:single-stranded-DNA-specific exonuclease RecJ [Klebsiella pneumoniae]
IAAVHEANVAKELGIDLIITDHHEPPPELPEALAIIHPKLDVGVYPFHYLAGVGVAFKVAHALLGRVPEHLLEIAVIGTVADLVSLHGEN